MFFSPVAMRFNCTGSLLRIELFLEPFFFCFRVSGYMGNCPKRNSPLLSLYFGVSSISTRNLIYERSWKLYRRFLFFGRFPFLKLVNVCSHHRTSPAAIACGHRRSSLAAASPHHLSPSLHQSITAPVQQPKFAALGILERSCWISYFFSYLLFLCRQLSFDWDYPSLTVQQKFAAITAPVQPH